MFDYLGVLGLVLLVVVSGWLVRRAWRARRPILKWLATALSAGLMLVAAFALGAVLLGYWKLNRDRGNPVPTITVAATPEQIARGARFEPYCSGCHAPETGAAMTGRDFLGPKAPPIGRFHAPNLTPVQLADWSDGEIVRAIREGIHRSGRTLLIMPSSVLRNLSDDDVQAIVAYLRSLPPEGVRTPPNALNALGAGMIHLVPIIEAQPPVTEPIVAPRPGPTAAYGAYLASFTCAICHGADLMGDPTHPAPPVGTVPLMWTQQQFIDFMRTGNKPGGIPVDGETMPWKTLSQFLSEDDELRALYAHLEEKAAALRD